MPPPPPPSGWPDTLSTLIHGTDESAVSSVAAGFALRYAASFAWADCADLKGLKDGTAHRILGGGSRRPVVDRVDESVLRAPRWTRGTLERMFLPDGLGLEPRFASYLKMPELYQRLIAHACPPEGHAVIVLANVDAIPASIRARVIEPPDLHEAIHQQGVTFVATSRDRPSTGMVLAFDLVLRVDVPAHGRWYDGCLRVEKGTVPQLAADPTSLREAWERLGFDTSLFRS